MMWRVGLLGRLAGWQPSLDRGSSAHIGGQNLARFKNTEFDAIYNKMRVMPDGPERLQLFDEAKRLLIAYAPYKWGVHRIHTDIAQPWLHGYRRPPYWTRLVAVRRHRRRSAGEGDLSEPAAISADERRQSLPLPRCRCRTIAQPIAQKVFRYAFPAAETGFDPAQISDLYSRTSLRTSSSRCTTTTTLHVRRSIKPLAAAALPEMSADFRIFTFPIRRGIFFQDDPAFKGVKRELVAQDFVYALKRFFDPRWKSPIVSGLEEYKILGLNELRQRSLKERTPFRTTLRSKDCVRSTDTRCRFAWRRPRRTSLRRSRIPICSAQWRAKSSKCTATRSWRIRSEPGRSGSPTGGARRASCWSEIRIIAKRFSTRRLPPAIRAVSKSRQR